MKPSVHVALVLLAAGAAAPLWAQSAASTEPAAERGVPLLPLLESVASHRGKKLLVDPRVQGSVRLYGQDPARIDYDELLGLPDRHYGGDGIVNDHVILHYFG